MYRSCLFCSAALGSNDSIERFPVGRSLAFDGEKGRLWAVCPRCARWNLAPLEERWEAAEDAERLFRDTRVRTQSENIGLCRLPDGTRLVRVGQALPGEVAAWRYGREMRRRAQRQEWARFGSGVEVALGGLVMVAGAFAAPLAILAAPVQAARLVYQEVSRYRRADRVAHRVPAWDSPTGQALDLRWRDLRLVRTALDDHGSLELEVWQTREMPAGAPPVALTGPAATAVLGKALVQINGAGAREPELDWALERLMEAGGAEPFLRRTVAEGYGLEVPGLAYGELFETVVPFSERAEAREREERARPKLPLMHCGDPAAPLALEMALHEETERRAMQGELAMLEAMWRHAEEIAAIADALPDVPPPDPPRLRAES